VRNTWLHSFALIAATAPLLALAFGLAMAAPPAWIEPARTFAMLAPGLALGWFARRHPLLVGAAAGVLAVIGLQPPLIAESSLTAGMTVAVAALAGRALRFRFKPEAPATPP
jgi:hypothetical protein